MSYTGPVGRLPGAAENIICSPSRTSILNAISLDAVLNYFYQVGIMFMKKTRVHKPIIVHQITS